MGPFSTSSGSVRPVVLDWPTRLQIAVGAAQGLCYMHHDCSSAIVHRDVKSSNILLDSEFKPKIADFGLAKILAKRSEPNTMSAVAGSFGYIAPGKRTSVFCLSPLLHVPFFNKSYGHGLNDRTNRRMQCWTHNLLSFILCP